MHADCQTVSQANSGRFLGESTRGVVLLQEVVLLDGTNRGFQVAEQQREESLASCLRSDLTLNCAVRRTKDTDGYDLQIVEIEEQDNASSGDSEAREDPIRIVIDDKSSPSLIRERKVRFLTLHIHEHPVVAGDNPSCLNGTPISIGWESVHSYVLPIPSEADDESKSPPRSYREMRLPACVRHAMLREAGYSRNEIVILTRPVNIVRAQRARTVETLSLFPLENALESATQGFRRLLLRKKARLHRRYLKMWRNPEAMQKQMSEKGLKRWGSTDTLPTTGDRSSTGSLLSVAI